jgi:hypothetical protein
MIELAFKIFIWICKGFLFGIGLVLAWLIGDFIDCWRGYNDK